MFDAIVGGLSDLAGGIISRNSNAREAEKNRGFQAEMSNTARQRDVADLKAAGLNPVLAAGYGGSSPSGSTSSMSAPSIGGAMSNARNATSNAENSKTNKQVADQNRQLIDAQIKSLLAGAAKTSAEARSSNVAASLDEGGAKAVEKLAPGAKLLMQLGSMFSARGK